LTPVEQSLVDHVSCGEWFDLGTDDEVNDKAVMRSWGNSRTCRAVVIRDILRGRLAPHLDPHGLRLRGARIIGQLDLENLSTEVNLELKDCFLEEGLVARDAHLATFAMTGCQIDHPAEPPLDAERVTCSMLSLVGARIIGHADRGALNLAGAHIGSLLDCTGATLRNDSGPALNAHGLQVDQTMFLSDSFTAIGTGDNGAVDLAGAHVGGSFYCTGATLRNDSGRALNADGLQVDQTMFLSGSFTATATANNGAVNLIGAHVGGSLECEGATLRNDSGIALVADGLQVNQTMFLRGFTATGVGENGTVRLIGAHVGIILDCDRATLRNDSGPALNAEGLQVDHGMLLSSGFTASGVGGKGAVRLAGAHVGSYLNCTEATLRNDSGPALNAGSLQVDQTMLLSSGFTASGVGKNGAVNLAGAHVGGSLDCTGATLRNDSGPALFANALQVDQNMFLRDGFTATGAGDGATVDLTSTRVGGILGFAPKTLTHATDAQLRLAVDGLTYTGVPDTTSGTDWLDLLQDATRSYAAQPYQKLAAGYRALGDDRQARKTLMRQRRDQLRRNSPRPGWPERSWGRITHVTLGYGYQPWRALLFLAAVVVLSCALAVALGSHSALGQTDKTATPGRPCTVLQQVSVGLDLNLPVGTSVGRTSCDLTKDSTSATAASLTAASWVLRILAWVFAALFIAGFTSAVRKT
jgi:hypothetical protein